jgi:hypothetical protein
MQKQFTQFKTVVQGLESLFHFESGSTTAIVKEALLDCLKWIGQIEDANKAQADAQAQAQAAAQKAVSETQSAPPAEENDVQH